MNKRDIVIGFVIFAIVVGIIFFAKRPKITPIESPNTTPTSTPRIEQVFNYTIPDDVEKIDLKDVTGSGFSGIATRKYENGKFEFVVLADIEDPLEGSYQAWLTRGKEGEVGFSYVKLGNLRMAKGGYLLEFESSTDYTSYSQVLVTLEKKDDTKMEERILEGSF